MKNQFTRRNFIKGLGAGMALSASGIRLAGHAAENTSRRKTYTATEKTGFIKALWVHINRSFPNGEKDVPVVLDKWADAGFTLVIPHVRGVSGETYYRNTKHPIVEYARDWDPLEVINTESRKRGMKVHPWCSVFRGARSEFAKEHPELIGRDKNGEMGDYFLCAAQDEVHEWAWSFFKEIMDNYDVVGVHHDYVRYADYLCCCDHCRSVFRRETGIEMHEMERGSPEWARWITMRVNHINRFVRRVQSEAKSRGKETSAAVFAGYPHCIESVAQDWLIWGHEKWVDYLLPMNYWGDRNKFNRLAEIHLNGVNNAVPVIEGVANKLPGKPFEIDLSPEELYELSDSVKNRDFQGICYFVSQTLTDEDLKMIKKI